MSRLQEVVSPPDRIEADLAVVFFEPATVAPDGPAGLFDCRLGGVLADHLRSTEGGRLEQRLLVRSSGRIASPWVLFFPLAKVGVEPPQDCLAEAVDTALDAGFGCLAMAPPVERWPDREYWLGALQEILGRPEKSALECLVTFNRSYLHDHAAAVFNL
ncbi:hypothetical protein EDC39_101426 [Geothermobacter ehrlichii]|uniref:Uncharacterized protein n=1 Tax=Geothermobacter ehrlichii TaxID=213224 RepID=A0A5D3WP04_9BACT|nr:hypothetical protein [Geothermobacter ehrlichii]TYP00265.1 hypothetical protein EDC39_101426 [Geothermobacter ehrlichii]